MSVVAVLSHGLLPTAEVVAVLSHGLLGAESQIEDAVRGWVASPGGRVWSASGSERNWLAAPGQRVWRQEQDAMGALVRNTIEKTAGDAVRYFMDFGDAPEIEAGAEISSCTVSVSPSGPTVVSPATVNTAGYLASTKISGGTAGTDYEVLFTATLNDADSTVLARSGTLQVR